MKTRVGRPRKFDVEVALNSGERLFHTYGYGAVGVAALTEEIGINPPSFYKAFGSKSEFFEAILARYFKSVLPLDQFLRPGRPVQEALEDLLEQAAILYSKDQHSRGCLVLEATRGNADQEEVVIARRFGVKRRDQIVEFLNGEKIKNADAVTDFVGSVMSGLSASAREGMPVARLVAVARAASPGIAELLSATPSFKNN